MSLSQTALKLLEEMRKDCREDRWGLTIIFIAEKKTTGAYVPFLWDGVDPPEWQSDPIDLDPIIAAVNELVRVGILKQFPSHHNVHCYGTAILQVPHRQSSEKWDNDDTLEKTGF